MRTLRQVLILVTIRYVLWALMFPHHLIIGQLTLIGAFSIIVTGVIGLTHYASPPSNPFTAYADIMPGQPSAALDRRGFTCQNPTSGYLYNKYNDHSYGDPSICTLEIAQITSAIYHIEVSYSKGVIQLTHFEFRNDSLSLGDLTEIFNLEVRQHYYMQTIMLPTRQRYISIVSISPCRGFWAPLHVRSITLTNTPFEQ
ncbi:MAG: hypothetical protein KF716_11100 [Anaerolineae bacterium]|nr:hypothetical protein [Anaerolineae bacterium]